MPGALGAWRTVVLREIGGLTPDTVAEDADLTIAVRRRGWRIRYDDGAIGWTQAPENVRGLVSQRFRWTYGTLQAVYKHRDTLLRPRFGSLGFVALPNILLFQILLPVFSPLIDLLFLGSLLLFGLSQLHFARLPELWTGDDLLRATVFLVAFMVIDFLTGVLAFAHGEGRGVVAARVVPAAALLLPTADVRGARALAALGDEGPRRGLARAGARAGALTGLRGGRKRTGAGVKPGGGSRDRNRERERSRGRGREAGRSRGWLWDGNGLRRKRNERKRNERKRTTEFRPVRASAWTGSNRAVTTRACTAPSPSPWLRRAGRCAGSAGTSIG